MNYQEAVEEAKRFSLRTGLVAHVLEFPHGHDWVESSWFSIGDRREEYGKQILYTTNPCELDPDLCIDKKDLKNFKNMDYDKKEKLMKKTIQKLWDRFSQL